MAAPAPFPRSGNPTRPTAVAEGLRLDPATAGPAGRSVGRLLTRLHTAVPGGIGARRRPDGWFDWAGRPGTDAPVSERNSVLHLDVHPENLLAAASGAVVALIDWANARTGPAAADLPRTRVTLDLASQMPAHRTLGPAIETFWDGLVREYGGLPVSRQQWAWYLEWAAAVQRRELDERRGPTSPVSS